MDPSLQPLRSPILLDNDHTFDRSRFSDIRHWLDDIMTISEEERRLQSPICLPDHSCPSISRKKRIGAAQQRQTKRLRWGLPPQHRFFDKVNWMDEADRRVPSMSVEEQRAWRDAYTVMISRPGSYLRRESASISRRRRRADRSPHFSPYTLISLPVCPPLTLDPASSPCTPTCTRTCSRFIFPHDSPALAVS